MSEATRLRALTEAGLLHPNPDAVLAPLFTAGSGFFLASDKVQVKYEMLRAHWSTACLWPKLLRHMVIRGLRTTWWRWRSTSRGWRGCSTSGAGAADR